MKALDSFCQTNSFLKTKFALMTFYNIHYSIWTERIILLIEYLQLMSQGLLLHASYSNTTQESSDSPFFSFVLYLFQLINPSFLMPLQTFTSLSLGILVIVFSSTLAKYLLFGYILAAAHWNWKTHPLLVNIWRWIFKLQSRILCYFTTSFWINVIIGASLGTFSVGGLGQAGIVGSASIWIALEYIFTFALETQFSYVLPAKSYLASKDYRTQVVTLVQKLILQIMQMAFSTDLKTCAWMFGVINLIMSAFKSFHFYEILPVYNLQALILQGDLLSIVFSLNLACFVHIVLVTASYEEATTNLIIIFWVMLAILIGKLCREVLVKRILRLLTRPAGGTPECIVHKVSAVKQLRRIASAPSEGHLRFDKFYLLSLILNTNIQEIFHVSLQSMAAKVPDLHIEKDADDIFQEYLTRMSTKFSRDSLVNLYLAYLCSKNPSLYMKAIKIISGFKQKVWSKNHLSSTMLLYEIEKVKLSNQSQQDTSIDLLTYIKSQILVEDLRNSMLKETDLKITICNNILGEAPNIGQVYNCAQKIYKSKLQTQKKISQISSTLPDSFIEPLLICGRYHLVLDYAAEDYQKYTNLYLQKYTKYDRQFRELTFTKENLYQDGNVFLIISGEKSNSGQIAFATHSIENLCGNSAASYKGSHISTLFTPSFQPIYNNILRKTFETGENKLLENLERAFICHKNGYIVETEFYLKVHPYISCGFYLDMIIRPVPSTTKEYLIVKEDGTIEGATKAIGEALHISTSNLSSVTCNVKQISEELWKMNQAFNMLSKNKNKQATDDRKSRGRQSLMATDEYKQALELYSVYTSGGKIVQCMPIPVKQAAKKHKMDNSNDVYYFGCNVSVRTHEDTIIKIVSLETADEEEDEQDHQIEQLLQEKKLDFGEDYETKELADLKTFKSESIKNPESGEEEENVDCQEYVELASGDQLNTYGVGLLSLNSGSNTIVRNPTRTLFNPGQSATFRQNETIDCKSPKVNEVLSNDNRMTTYGVLLSPTSSVNVPINFKQTMSPKFVQNSQFQNQHERTRKELRDLKSSEESSKRGKGDFVSSQYLQQSIHDKVVYKSFKAALSQDFHPKSFNILCVGFYSVILFTLITQIIVKTISDNTMEALAVKKDLLTYSQLTTFKMMLIDINARGGVNGIIDPSVNRGVVDGGIVTAMKNIRNHMKDLRNYNQHVIDGIQSLDKDIKEQVLAKNTEVLGSYYDINDTNIRYVTYFGLVDSIVDCVQKVFGLPVLDYKTSPPYFNFIIKNALNDFLSKAKDLKNIFIGSVNSEKSYLTGTITLCLIITPMLLIGIVFTLAMIIWHQYRTEKDQMMAFIKLKPETIQDILRRLTDFKKKLDDREYIDHEDILEIYDNKKVNDSSSYHKRHDAQKINYSETRLRYFKYVFQISGYIAVLLAIMLWNYISALVSTNVIYRRQSQLEFANYISETISVSFAASSESLSSNDTTLVEHRYPIDFMLSAFQELTDMQTQIATRFMEVDGSYYPAIQDMLYLNVNCSQYNITTASYVYYCNYLVNHGQRINLVALVSLYRTLYQSKINDALTCNKSTISTLLTCAYRNNDMILPAFALGASEAQMVAGVVSNNIQDNIDDAYSSRKLFLIMFAVSLVIVGFLIWIQILTKLRNVHNDFKKVIQIFPPSLILSSFLLKSFLRKHSREFDNTRNSQNYQ